MKIVSRILFLGSFLLATAAPADIRSKWIWIEQGGVVADEKGDFHLIQIIGNTSEQPLWLTVRQGQGETGCEVTSKIEPKKNATFQCDVARMKPGKVPVVIAIFSDEARTQNLETLRDDMRFGRGDLRALTDFAAAQQLPIAYEGILFSEKLGAGAVLRQLFPHANGKLAISAAAVEYSDAKRTVNIPTSNMRAVQLVDAGGVVPWIIVMYQGSEGLRRVGFQPLNHPSDVSRIVFSLESAFRSARDGSETIPGRTLADPGLRRDTVRTIVENERVVAPNCTSPKVVDTVIVEEPSNMEVRNGRAVRGGWSESWMIDRCGTQVAYGVSYAADPNGGTFIAIRKP